MPPVGRSEALADGVPFEAPGVAVWAAGALVEVPPPAAGGDSASKGKGGGRRRGGQKGGE